MGLYLKYIALLLKSQLQYRASFAMTVFTQFLTPFTAFAGIYLLFERFGSIDGWTAYEVFLCFSIIGASFSIATCMARGFDMFPNMVKNAGFDRVLVRPRGTIIQVLGSGFDIKRIGHLIQAIVVLVIAITGVKINWNIIKILTLANMIIGGTCIFSGVYMLQAALAFWTVEGLEVANILTHGVREYASYPLSIFPKWITRFFTFIIPFSLVNYLPLNSLLGHNSDSHIFYMLLPLVGILFIVPCLLVWNLGVKHYSSTGS
ncbi:MAG TPA: ABC-2 family transporter protein [Clostridia bacterium]|nr:ABC-2 family transporter protein [Clostridia bacterium]